MVDSPFPMFRVNSLGTQMFSASVNAVVSFDRGFEWFYRAQCRVSASSKITSRSRNPKSFTDLNNSRPAFIANSASRLLKNSLSC